MTVAIDLETPEVEYDVSEFAKAQAEEYGREIGKDPKTASRKLASIIRAFLNNMEINEEETIPLPQTGNGREVLVFKKLGERRFSTSIMVTG